MRFSSRSTASSKSGPAQFITYAIAILYVVSSVIAQDVVASHRRASRLGRRTTVQMGLNSEPVPVLRQHLDVRQLDVDTSSPSSSTTQSARATSVSAKTVTTITASSTNTSIPASSDATSTASVTISTAPAYTLTSLPVPFDSSFGDNFTASSCPAFIQSFLSNSTFKDCAPVSLLLQNSKSFFRAVQSQDGLIMTLEKSCNASLAVCSPLMSSIAANLISDANCGEDFRRQNALVTQAYAGLVSYEPMFQASCLKNNSTRDYCMAEAFSNANNNTDPAADAVVYYLAIGLPMPTTSTPTCSTCLKQTMNVFAGYARMKGQPLSNTYLSAAQHLNTGCGTTYVDANVQVATQGSLNAGLRSAGGDMTQIWTMILMVFSISIALTI